MGSNLQPTGLYLVNAANPSATPLQVTSSALDSPPATGNGYTVENGYATLYSWTYDASTQQATGLQPALEVYGSGSHLYQISLTNPASGPQQLSSGSYAALCAGPFAYQAGPYGGSAPQYVVVLVDLVSGDNCATATDQQDWVIAAGTASSVVPSVATFNGYPVAAFWDLASGLLTGYLIMGPQSGGSSNLYLYSPSFVQQSAVVSNIPSADYVYGEGEINGTALIDVETYQGTTQPYSATDQLDLVSSSGAVMQVVSYSINNSSPYFNANCNGGQFTSWIWGGGCGQQFRIFLPRPNER